MLWSHFIYHSHHIWITCTVTCALPNASDSLVLWRNVFFWPNVDFGKLFCASLCGIRIPSLSWTLSKFCFPFEEKLSDWKLLGRKPPQIILGSVFLVILSSGKIRLISKLWDISALSHHACWHVAVDQLFQGFLNPVESSSKWQMAVLLWSDYCTCLVNQLTHMWRVKDIAKDWWYFAKD